VSGDVDKEEFREVLKGWKADAIIGLEEENLLRLIPGEQGLRLWGFLNTARSTGFYSLLGILLPFSYVLFPFLS